MRPLLLKLDRRSLPRKYSCRSPFSIAKKFVFTNWQDLADVKNDRQRIAKG
ncbi:MAG: hypothetical protein F6J89_30115 [Symploca sp. SIO1C4]|uniref:Uncharacterized protein n=1 Tax=Symploca sp. SIO1C4 TaxID=2607765 RepID=A0A6B3NJ42_9CYAN|nr:hypothetical protein [Symploca sp. SIO1C4]